MVNVTAATSFFGNEGMWRAGETKSVSAHRAHELIEEGLCIESSSQPSALHQAADAIGATVATDETAPALAAAADALGATVKTDDDAKATDSVTTDSTKKKPKPGADRETKEDGPADTK